MRVVRVIHEHRGGTCDSAFSFALRAVSKDTVVVWIPYLQDADPVCIRLQDLGNLRCRLITVPFWLECSGECLTT